MLRQAGDCVQEDPSVRLASEAMKAFNAGSLEDTGPAELPEALLQLLPKTLYRGESIVPV